MTTMPHAKVAKIAKIFYSSHNQISRCIRSGRGLKTMEFTS